MSNHDDREGFAPIGLGSIPIISLCAGCRERDAMLVTATDAMSDQNKRLAEMGEAGHALAVVVEFARAWRRNGDQREADGREFCGWGIAQSEKRLLVALDALDTDIAASGGDPARSLIGDGWSDPDHEAKAP